MNRSSITATNISQSDNTVSKSRQHSLRFNTRFPKPLFFIGGYNGGVVVESILVNMGWRKTNDRASDDYTLRWTEQISQVNFYHLKPNFHLVNHIPNCGIFTNKLGMLLSLRNYDKYCSTVQKVTQFKIDDFVPKTFILDDIKERNDFFSVFQEGDIWINKPTGSNQGKGINLMRSIETFKMELTERDYMSRNLMWGYETRIIQKYISNPLLIEGRKFDIRCFLLIASTIPYLVLFHPGYIRLSMNQYSNKDDDLITHLTNQFIQKQSPKYNEVKESTIWTIQNFNDYFNHYYKNLKNFKVDWVNTDLMETLKAILLHVFKSVKQRLANSTSYFEIYGFDFLVDDNLKVWLIEANSNPSMSLSCTVLKELVPAILEETILIALECFEKNARLNKDLLPLENIKHFQIIYSENYELARSRKTVHNAFKVWSAPRYSNNISDSKSISESTWTGKRTIPVHSRLSMPYSMGITEKWRERWEDSYEIQRKSMPNFKNKIPTPSEMILRQLRNNKDLSGDYKNIVNKLEPHNEALSIYPLQDPNLNSRLSSSSKFLGGRRSVVSTGITSGKLRNLIRSYE